MPNPESRPDRPSLWETFREVSSRKYAQPALCALLGEPRRFTEILTALTLSLSKAVHPHSMTSTLQWLQRQGLVAHQFQDATGTYCITERGRALVHMLTEVERTYRYAEDLTVTV